MNDKILVVEDEENIRTNIKEYLENQNYQVIEAADGEAGLEMVETMKPDLIILDLMRRKSMAWRFASRCAATTIRRSSW